MTRDPRSRSALDDARHLARTAARWLAGRALDAITWASRAER